MNRYLAIAPFRKYRKVMYYSVLEEDGTETTITESFFNEIVEQGKRGDLTTILSMISLMGEDFGAQKHFFRPENAANALPFPARSAKFHEINGETNLRLYCMRISEEVVILFNGGFKTAASAQKCPNVRYPFELANKISQAIDKMIVGREIIINGKHIAGNLEIIL